MDVAGLRDRIRATLDANAAVRQQAELDLKHVRVGRSSRGYETETDKKNRPKKSQVFSMVC